MKRHLVEYLESARADEKPMAYESVESDEAWINKMWWKLQTPAYHKELFKDVT